MWLWAICLLSLSLPSLATEDQVRCNFSTRCLLEKVERGACGRSWGMGRREEAASDLVWSGGGTLGRA